MADAQRPAGGDLREELEPDRVGQCSERLDRDVPGLGDDPRSRESSSYIGG